jgi:hypothetical protein
MVWHVHHRRRHRRYSAANDSGSARETRWTRVQPPILSLIREAAQALDLPKRPFASTGTRFPLT